MISYSELQKVSALFESNEWIFAKTMPENPHHYTLRKNWRNSEDFAWVVETMRRHGYTEYFKRRPYTMLNVNGRKYWTMGAPIPETILINRKPVDAPNDYDPIANEYDALFSDAESKAEERAVVEMLGDTSGSVLDIGCGTGMLLDYAKPALYTGIDPSKGMTDVLQRNHPGNHRQIVNARFEEFAGEKYDLIVSLFGTASYIQPEALPWITNMLNPGGRFFLMFFAAEYRPKTHIHFGIAPRSYGVEGIGQLQGAQSRFGDYVIVSGGAA